MPGKQQFSNKQKKAQLQAKRKRKQNTPYKYGNSDEEKEGKGPQLDKLVDVDLKLNTQPVGTAHERINKYALIFGAESKQEVDENKRKSREPLGPINEKLLETSVEDFSVESPELGMPKRGKWDYSMSKHKLELLEQKEFNEWTRNLDEHYHNIGKYSYYERNLETWRQLWRTLEMSDIVLFVCDIRYPTLHFSYSVYKYISQELGKQVILVLNKVDVVHPSVSVSWKRYFEEKYPDIRVILFSAFPDKQKLVENTSKGLLKRQTIRKPTWAYGADTLIQIARSHYDDSHQKKDGATPEKEIQKDTITPTSEEAKSDNFITIGLIGQPNAGKSSLINGILQDKRVSVSKTPGHTKHFQTIFYSEEIRLCDCPGLVFPTTAPKQLQVISGMFPVSQVKEPYSIVGYVAERIDLVSLLRITHPNIEDNPDEAWSAWYICYSWAEKNGYMTARTGRSDVYRGANSILRLVVTSRICVRLLPANFQPDLLHGSYQDVLQELVGFADKTVDKDEKEDSGESEEDSDSDEGLPSTSASTSSNRFALLPDSE